MTEKLKQELVGLHDAATTIRVPLPVYQGEKVMRRGRRVERLIDVRRRQIALPPLRLLCPVHEYQLRPPPLA